MNPRKMWLIARREYITNFRRRSFLFAVFGVPILITAITVIVGTLVRQSLEDISAFKRVGIVDKANVFVDANGTLIAGVKLAQPFEIVSSEEQAAEGVQRGTLDGYYVLPANFFANGQIDAYSRPKLPLSDSLQLRLQSLLKEALAARLGDQKLIDLVSDPLKEMVVYRVGSPEKMDATALVASFIVPMIVGILLFATAMSTSQFLMSGLVEEKESRMMELFVTSARPGEILAGKLLGLGALGLTQVGIWALLLGGFNALQNDIEIQRTIASLQITPGYLALLLGFFLLGYLVYSAVMMTIAVSVTADQESRQIGGWISVIFMLPYMLIFFYIQNPHGPIPMFLSMFPFTSPVGMVLRMSWANVPSVEIALSLLLLALAAVGLLWLASVIFRAGMLNYGKRLGLRQFVAAVRGQ